MSPVIDLMIRVKNGYLARNELIVTPYSAYREAVLEKIKALGYIKSYRVVGENKKEIVVELKYRGTEPAFTDVRIISKPGQRMYTAAADLKPVMSGIGYSVLSTPKGIRTNIEAKKENLGGELLFYIW